MLFRLSELDGFTVQALDGVVGIVEDFYFDDHDWVVRYLVLDANQLRGGRHVLLSPAALDQPDMGRKLMRLNIPKEMVENSPEIGDHPPVSRQFETELFNYYDWPYYWELGAPLGSIPGPFEGIQPAILPQTGQKTTEERGSSPAEEYQESPQDQHLHSLREVKGYRLHARDGEIGSVQDFIADNESWNVLYLVVETGGWLASRKVLVSPSWLERVSWAGKQVDIDLKRETVQKSPEYDPAQPLERDYEDLLYEHYDRQKYWRL